MYDQQQPMQYAPPYPSMPGHEAYNETSLKFQLEFDGIIDEICHVLKDEIQVIDRQTGEINWQPNPHGQPLINDLGMSRIKTVLRGTLDKNIPLSDLEEEHISEMASTIERDVKNMIFDNWDTFEIPDQSAASLITHIIGAKVFGLYRKALDGNYLRFLKTTYQTSEVQTYMQRQQPERQGPIGMFKKLMGGR